MAQFTMYQPITTDNLHAAFVSQYVKDNRKNMPDYGRKTPSEKAMNAERDFIREPEYNTAETIVFSSFGSAACGFLEEDEDFDGFI